VWLGGLAAAESPAWRRARKGTPKWSMGTVGVALAAVTLVESLATAPYYLSSFNLLVGGPGGGDAIVNDSNADWGQGLVALHDELARRGIGRVYLTYTARSIPACMASTTCRTPEARSAASPNGWR
jgi:hypothetical protein